MKYIAIDPALPPVSAISLGSWNTFSRLLFEDLVALLRRSLDLGVNFFDVGSPLAFRIVDMPVVTVRPSADDMQQIAVQAGVLASQLASR